jgi:hypothetical protein
LGWYQENTIRRLIIMTISRKLGILVFCVVPGIVGGGVVYAAYPNYVAVFIYELILLFFAGAFVSR